MSDKKQQKRFQKDSSKMRSSTAQKNNATQSRGRKPRNTQSRNTEQSNTHNRFIKKPLNTPAKENVRKDIVGEKAYKLLALQQKISTNKAKALIDSGKVSAQGRRVLIARALFPFNTRFGVIETECAVIFEDNELIALDKSVGVESYSLLDMHPNCKLINRLDKDTSGVILLAKNEAMRQKAIQAFKQKQVEKVYYALIEGKLYDEINIDKKIQTRKDTKARSSIDSDGLEAQSKVTPLQVFDNNTTLVSVEIMTGRTHQIRIHLASMRHPIIGDIIYNKTSTIKAKRLMLHCYKTALLGYTFQSSVDIHKVFGV